MIWLSYMEAGTYGDSNEFGERLCAAAIHNPCPMDLDGSVAYPELAGYHFMLIAFDEMHEHLKLSLAEFVEWWTKFSRDPRSVLVFLIVSDERAVDRFTQSLGRWGFFYEIYSSMLHGLDGCRNVTLAGDDYDRYFWPVSSEHVQDVEAIHVRQVDIEKSAGARQRRGFFTKFMTC